VTTISRIRNSCARPGESGALASAEPRVTGVASGLGCAFPDIEDPGEVSARFAGLPVKILDPAAGAIAGCSRRPSNIPKYPAPGLDIGMLLDFRAGRIRAA
jgi:hypothetical protein